MAKIFPTFPAHLEQFNPEQLPTQLELGERTFDEDGKPHSYNDKPLFSTEDTEDPADVFLFWFSHGENYREGDKPSCISFVNNEYTTYDENMEQHSYGGLPAFISYNTWTQAVEFLWYNHGSIHRDDDKPASIRSFDMGQTERYYKNGLKHRDNNLPAAILLDSKRWLVQDVLHNPEGLAVMQLSSQLRPEGISDWGLYGVKFLEDTFNQIKTFSAESGTPLWVSLFFALGIIKSEHIREFNNPNTGRWDSYLPVEWYLRLWGVDEKSFVEGINESADFDFHPRFNPGMYLSDLIKVVKYEEQNMLQVTVQEEDFNV